MKEANGICPCCGNSLNISRGIEFHDESHTLISSDFAIVFTGYEAQVFALFWRNRNSGRPLTRSCIFDHLYALDPSGGPDTKVIDILLCRIRKLLANTSLEIVNIHNAGWLLQGKNENAPLRINKRALAREAAE